MSRLMCVGGRCAGQFQDVYDPKHGMRWRVHLRRVPLIAPKVDDPVPETVTIEFEDYRVNEFRGHHGDEPIFVLGPQDWSPTKVLAELLTTYLKVHADAD